MEEIEGPLFLTLLVKRFWPGCPIPVDLLFMWLAVLLVMVFALTAAIRCRLRPAGAQNAFEMILDAVSDFTLKFIGKDGFRFLPLFFTLFLVILFSNLLGLIPGFKSPTANLNINAGMALVVAIFPQYVAIRHRGILGYLRSFCGPPYWLAPLFIIIRVIEQLARPLSLTMRLFGNIMAKEILLGILVYLMTMFFFSHDIASRLLFPVPFLMRPLVILLGVLVSVIQALVFTSLSMIYIGEAIHEH